MAFGQIKISGRIGYNCLWIILVISVKYKHPVCVISKVNNILLHSKTKNDQAIMQPIYTSEMVSIKIQYCSVDILKNSSIDYITL